MLCLSADPRQLLVGKAEPPHVRVQERREAQFPPFHPVGIGESPPFAKSLDGATVVPEAGFEQPTGAIGQREAVHDTRARGPRRASRNAFIVSEIVAALPFPIQPPHVLRVKATPADDVRLQAPSESLADCASVPGEKIGVAPFGIKSAQAVESGAADEHAVLGESRLGPFRDTQPRPLVLRQVGARKGFHEAEDGVEFRIRRQRFNLPGELSWRPQIVGVDEGEGVARRLGGGAVESGAHSRIRLADQNQPRPETRQDRGRPIRRPVVDGDDLERRRTLVQHRLHRLPDIGGCVPTGEKDGHPHHEFPRHARRRRTAARKAESRA